MVLHDGHCLNPSLAAKFIKLTTAGFSGQLPSWACCLQMMQVCIQQLEQEAVSPLISPGWMNLEQKLFAQ